MAVCGGQALLSFAPLGWTFSVRIARRSLHLNAVQLICYPSRPPGLLAEHIILVPPSLAA